MIVVDTNIVAYLYFPCVYTEAAIHLLEADPDWNAPLLWRSEFRNILTGYMRRGDLELEHACAIQTAAELLLVGAEHQGDSKQVLRLAHESNCSAYDCEFVALAHMLAAPLFTMDGKIIKAFPAVAKSLITNATA
ncbi:MAG: type II toxin-antitoxin system VapC family toxin [Desulfobulbaceae bacterium]|jgi:predicted nucleic acid-binding protein|nr:type II toxin-antitoxin system VapC family toxin [Desulfobulbaceae bacterium]